MISFLVDLLLGPVLDLVGEMLLEPILEPLMGLLDPLKVCVDTNGSSCTPPCV